MEYDELFQEFERNANEENARYISAYMRGKFPFLGIKTPARQALSKDFLARAKALPAADWDFVRVCWAKDEREYQYLAVNYLSALQPVLTPDDVPRIRDVAVEKSWWDTIDGLDRVVGAIALRSPEVNATLVEWSLGADIWLRRIAIDHQLTRKDRTNAELLARIIENCLGTNEFFINKAIGWSLREYSKTNREWVRNFITRVGKLMSPLSIREASKYL